MLRFFAAVNDRTKKAASARPRRARIMASRSSLLRSLCEIVRVFRGLATTTSVPRESRNRLIHGE